jgi:AraC-like DNA-binding protein
VPKKELKQLSYDTLKKSFWDNERNPKKQLEYANAYLIKAKSENNPVQKSQGYLLLSIVSKNDKALHYLDSAIVYSKDLHDIKFPAYAYYRKGYILQKQFKYRDAIDNFLIAESIAKINNLDFYYNVKFSIAALRSEELGEVEEALLLYRECFNYYKDKGVRTSQYSYDYQYVVFALADAYKALHQTDAATYYNKLGYRESKFTNNEELNALFILNEGANLVLKKNYIGALDSINKALPKMIAYKNVGNTLAAFYYLGKSFEGLGKKELATKNFIKVDSIYKISKRITPEFMSGYPFLISYYKDNGDAANQLKYITKYMYIDSVLQINYKELSKKLQKEYDAPHLFSEKEKLIQYLKKEEILSYWILGTLFLLLIGIGIFGGYQYKHKKQYRLRFDAIMHQTKVTNENQTPILDINEIKPNSRQIVDIGIAEELVSQILEKLTQMETQKGFLQSNFTIQILSENFDTNSKYVSKIVNTYKGKTFIQYINDLRIEYALEELKNNHKLLNYTIQALAQEFGFNSAESFSAAFNKKTGIKPTYFIKELIELNKT